MQDLHVLVTMRSHFGEGDFTVLLGKNDYYQDKVTCNKEFMALAFKNIDLKKGILDLRKFGGNASLYTVLSSYGSAWCPSTSFGDLCMLMEVVLISRFLGAVMICPPLLDVMMLEMVKRTLPGIESREITGKRGFRCLGLDPRDRSRNHHLTFFARFDARCSGTYLLDDDNSGDDLDFFDSLRTSTGKITERLLQHPNDTDEAYDRTIARHTRVVSAWIIIIRWLSESFPEFTKGCANRAANMERYQDVLSQVIRRMDFDDIPRYIAMGASVEENVRDMIAFSILTIFIKLTSFACPVMPHFLDHKVMKMWTTMDNFCIDMMFLSLARFNSMRRHSQEWTYVFAYALFWADRKRDKLVYVLEQMRYHKAVLHRLHLDYFTLVYGVYDPSYSEQEDRRMLMELVEECTGRGNIKGTTNRYHSAEDVKKLWVNFHMYRCDHVILK
jgi:hypothetical protein